MTVFTRRDFLRYAAWGSALVGSGLFVSRAAIGKEVPTGTSASRGQQPLAVCISDFHIGERYGGATRNPGNPEDYLKLDSSPKDFVYVRKQFIDFLKSCRTVTRKHGKTEYLIILGDMWDMAMNNQEDSLSLSALLFHRLDELNEGIGLSDLFEKVIYVPGNHDHHFWEMLQERYWVTSRLEKGLAPLEMPRVVSLTVDITTGDMITGGESPGGSKIPLNNLASRLLGLTGRTPVYIAYPHIFLRKPKGEYLLLTHGHLFEPNWNMVTMMFGDLMKQRGIPMTIRNIEMFNAITTELHSYSLGQTPPYEFWEKLYDRNFNHQVPVAWQKGVKEILDAHFSVRRIESDPKTPSTKYHDIEALQGSRPLVEHYLSQAEQECPHKVCHISSLVYGHTHIPSAGQTFMRYQDERKRPITIYNTGGWVNINPDTFHMPKPMLIHRDGHIAALDQRQPAAA